MCDMGLPKLASHPYRGLWAAIATMHRKERAIAPPLCHWFDMAVTTAPGIDTDALGTFTGEVERKGTMVDAARAKAKLAIARTGAPIGIGSEGSFGPNRYIPFLASGQEILLLREAQTGHEIVVPRRTPTNFDHVIALKEDQIDNFLDRMGFPTHAVVVRSEDTGDVSALIKGVVDPKCFRTAVEEIAARSASGRVMIQTDMRAHVNPTRMAAIGRAARWLALRTARCCPRCQAPGFGLTNVERGLICGDCGMPTELVRAEIHSCQACGYSTRKFERPEQFRAEPRWCQFCNP
jgi:hypothetical protein